MSNKQQPVIVGLDIGTTKVVAIAGRKNEYGKLEIVGFGRADSEGVTHGVVMNIEQCVRSVQLAIQRCIDNNPLLTINQVYVGIAGKHIKSMQAQGSRVRASLDTEISKDDVEQLLRDQYRIYLPSGDQIIDIIPQDYTVDNIPGITDPVGMSGMKVEANFHVITGDGTAIRNIKRCVDRAGLRTSDLVLQPLASAAAVMNEEDMEAGVAIVDIGGGTTDMAVFCDGVLKHTAVIPYAGMNITNDILTGLRVLRSQAEQMKVQFGSALASAANKNNYITIPGLRGLPPKEVSELNLANIIQARIEEILEYVMFNLTSIGLEKRLMGGIILTGGGSRLKGLVQLTEFYTGMGTRLGFPSEHLTAAPNDQVMNPMYSTCIGLILRGYDDYETGKTEFAGENANVLRIELEPVEAVAATAPEARTATVTDTASRNEEKMNKRKETMAGLFDRLRGKFMDFFEDTEDREL